MADAPSIWYVHPYAGGPGIGRYDRPFHLARHWRAAGVPSVIITPSHHHLLDRTMQEGTLELEDASYEFLASPDYTGNGAGRLLNMATYTWRVAASAAALARRHGPPLMVIASSPHPYAFLAARYVARRFSVPCVFEVRDLWPLSLVELAGVSPAHPLVRVTGWLERYAYSRADAVVSLLPCTKDHMERHGLRPGRWRYIPNGIEPAPPAVADADPEPARLARAWREQGRTVIVYAGALGRPNHVDSLVRAMALQRDQGRRSAAIVVGRGELQSNLAELVQSLDLGDSVRMFDQIPKPAVQQLLLQASAGYISLRPEPLFRFGVSPNKLFDYMLAALPVIFAVKAGNDPVAEAGCGMSVDPGDPRLISDAISTIAGLSEPERLRMGERGRTYVVERHSYARLAHDYLALARELA